jgi:hypothetical protein
MKFVTVMDMWLLIMNGILLGCILYYGRKLLALVARFTNRQDKIIIQTAIMKERKRIITAVEYELNIFNQAHMMGDEQSKVIVDEIKLILEIIKDKKI